MENSKQEPSYESLLKKVRNYFEARHYYVHKADTAARLIKADEGMSRALMDIAIAINYEPYLREAAKMQVKE